MSVVKSPPAPHTPPAPTPPPAPKKSNLKRRGARRWPSNEDSPAAEPSACTKAYFSQTVYVRQHSVHDEDGNKIEGSEVHSEEGLGPEGIEKTAEQMEASNKQRDIDYVFVYTLHSFSEDDREEMINSNIVNFGVTRARNELTREREAYTPTVADILQKCILVLGELGQKDKIDIKGGTATLTIGGECGLPVEYLEKLKNYLQSQEYRDFWNK